MFLMTVFPPTAKGEVPVGRRGSDGGIFGVVFVFTSDLGTTIVGVTGLLPKLLTNELQPPAI